MSYEPKWSFDLDAVRQAIDELAIEKPITVSTPSNIRVYGRHYFRRGRHYVKVNPYISAEDASRTLWHELTHCKQEEQGKLKDYMQQRRAKRVVSGVYNEAAMERYYTIPAEAEAKASEDNHERLPLVIDKE